VDDERATPESDQMVEGDTHPRGWLLSFMDHVEGQVAFGDTKASLLLTADSILLAAMSAVVTGEHPLSTGSLPRSERCSHWHSSRSSLACSSPSTQSSRDAGPGLRSTLVPASHGQRCTIPFPSGPMQAGNHAARGSRRHVDPLRPTGAARHTSHSRSSTTRTARRQRRGHRSLSVRTPGMPWTPGHRTHGHWTPLDRLDRRTSPLDGRTPPRQDRAADRATTGLAGVQTSSRPATTPWAARPRPGHGAWGRSATQDGSAATAPAPRPDRRRHWTAAQHRPASGRPDAVLSSEEVESGMVV
jgi:hypothetical protein